MQHSEQQHSEQRHSEQRHIEYSNRFARLAMAVDAGLCVRIEFERAYVVRFFAARIGVVVFVASPRGFQKSRCGAPGDIDVFHLLRLCAHAVFAVALEFVPDTNRWPMVAARLDASG